jgi:small subunit ribosomal protein S29
MLRSARYRRPFQCQTFCVVLLLVVNGVCGASRGRFIFCQDFGMVARGRTSELFGGIATRTSLQFIQLAIVGAGQPHVPVMPPSICLRSFAQLSLDAGAIPSAAPRLLHPRMAFFSTSAARSAVAPKKKGMVAAPKKGVKSLNTKKGKKAAQGDSGKRPAQGERKALRKRIVLSNNNALEVSSLKDLDKNNVFNEKNQGQVMGLHVDTVDALRAVDAFKPSQGWSLFRRPAVLMRKEAIQLAKLFKEVEDSAQGQQKKTIRRILSGDRMSGKTTLLLQGLAMGLLREWFVINLPEGKRIVTWRS